ncbi:MAG: peptidylprolyl isomerase [Myxococcota bacterium]|nr:peptidylprolyl isomerase [Myxococcota bacterium]
MKALLIAAVAVPLCALAQTDAGALRPAASGQSVDQAPELPLFEEASAEQQGKWTRLALAGRPLWAILKTSKGQLVVRLFSKDAPRTVANFVALASGERQWTHPFTQTSSRRRLYDGALFHRVIPGFMIQGGDPSATGRGGPGYRFADELSSGRTFDRPGLLAMANRGPDTNGSQFFITVTPPDALPVHLDGKHTIFGEVVKGYEVAVAISKVPADDRGRPSQEEVLLTAVEVRDRLPKGLRPEVKRQ